MNEPLAPFDVTTPTESVPASADPAAAVARDAAAAARPHPLHPFRGVLDLLYDLVIAVVTCLLLIAYVVQAFKVQGSSMVSQLHDGERILVNKFIYRFEPIERGDVVVFWYPDDPDVSFIKRVIGRPGDVVEIRHGVVHVNGTALLEPYVAPENADGRSMPAQRVREGHYFVLGDNRRGSNDSRSWGLVPRRYIYGKAFIRIWPLQKFGRIQH